jgi:tol-pal system protein YbgF
MPRRLWLVFVVVVAGCATSQQPGSGSAAEGGEGRTEDSLRELAKSQNEQARRIAELEARLALLETDARRARGLSEKPSTTVRIGAAEQAPAGREREPADEANTELSLTAAPRSEAPESGGRRPNVKLHGKPRPARSESNADLPPIPVTNETLPVVPLPQDRSRARQADSEPAAAVSDSPTSDYRAALHLVRERRFEDAALALSKFVAENPNHALIDRALYWLAEVRYATRDYREALAGFEKVLERFPNSEKAPDALYKLGMCWRRLGSEDKARSYFRRLRTEFPNSEAAGLASREGST